MYQSILADPPWKFHNSMPSGDGTYRAAHHQYACLSVEDIALFLRFTPAYTIVGDGAPTGWTMIEDLIAPDAMLWLWAPSAFILDGSATRVARAWGFEPKQIVTWLKGRHTPERLIVQMGLGRYTRNCTEHLLVCTRGRAQKLFKSCALPNYFVAPRTRHSAKPEAQYGLIEAATDGPYLELFARSGRAGWHAIGDELPAPSGPAAAASVRGADPSDADLSHLGNVA